MGSVLSAIYEHIHVYFARHIDEDVQLVILALHLLYLLRRQHLINLYLIVAGVVPPRQVITLDVFETLNLHRPLPPPRAQPHVQSRFVAAYAAHALISHGTKGKHQMIRPKR